MIALANFGAMLSASCRPESMGISSNVTAVCLRASTLEWCHALRICCMLYFSTCLHAGLLFRGHVIIEMAGLNIRIDRLLIDPSHVLL